MARRMKINTDIMRLISSDLNAVSSQLQSVANTLNRLNISRAAGSGASVRTSLKLRSINYSVSAAAVGVAVGQYARATRAQAAYAGRLSSRVRNAASIYENLERGLTRLSSEKTVAASIASAVAAAAGIISNFNPSQMPRPNLFWHPFLRQYILLPGLLGLNKSILERLLGPKSNLADLMILNPAKNWYDLPHFKLLKGAAKTLETFSKVHDSTAKTSKALDAATKIFKGNVDIKALGSSKVLPFLKATNKVTKVLTIAGSLGAVGGDVYQAIRDGKPTVEVVGTAVASIAIEGTKYVAKQAAGEVGLAVGMKAGAAVGTVFGPAGTAVGAVVGGAVGYFLASEGAGKIVDAVGNVVRQPIIDLTKTVANAGKTAYQFASNVGKKVVNGVGNAISGVGNAIAGGAKKVASFLSPKRLFAW